MRQQSRLVILAAFMGVMATPGMASAGLFDIFHRHGHNPQPAPIQVQPEQQDPNKPETADEENQAALNQFHNQPRLRLPMKVTRTAWTDDDEVQFGQFVHQIGQAVFENRCGTVTTCFQNPAINPYAKQDPKGLVLYSDCADFPYFLRAYYAFHNGLPFSYVVDHKMATTPSSSAEDKDGELATDSEDDSPYGNLLTARGRSNVLQAQGQAYNFVDYISTMFDDVSTSTYRVGPLSANYNLSDIYPVKIDKNGIGPGTIVATTGHVMIVWNITPDGMVQIIDGHPGAYVQYHPLDSSKLDRSRPDQGLGFFRFRPLTLLGGKKDGSGAYYGGRIVSATDQDLYKSGRWSMEQWFGAGTNVAPGSQVDPNAWKVAYGKVGFFDYLKSQLRDPNFVAKAEDSVVVSMNELCSLFQDRMTSIQSSVDAGLPSQEHPDDALPQNIFGSKDAAWERFSTPSSDGRLKDQVRSILASAVSQFRLAKSGSHNVVFKGSAQDFANTLRSKLAEINLSCDISYNNSNGENVSLSLNQALARLTKMSFDPYMCPEKSWGASGTEMSTCQDNDVQNWYGAEANIRNTVGKQDANENFVVRSDRPITLDMLQNDSLVDRPSSSAVNMGTHKAPITDLDAALGSQSFLQKLNGN